MKKIFSKVIAFAFVLCASIAMFACSQKDINIKTIELVGEMPPYIVIGEFDQANIKIKVTYEDDSTEVVSVTTNMIAGADREKLDTAGNYEVTILFKGEDLVLNVKMVEKSAINLVKFYDGKGRLISTQFVLDGETAVAPNADWLKMNGYNFVAWDRTFTNITEDTNIYGIYTKVEDVSVSQEEMKAKLNNAYTYLKTNDHTISNIVVHESNDEVSVGRYNYNYHYNNGEFVAQIYADDGYGVLDKNNVTAYFKDSEMESIQHQHNPDDSDLSTFNFIHFNNYSILDITNNTSTVYSSALYGNRNLYTATLSSVRIDSPSNLTVVFDDEKIWSFQIAEEIGDCTYYYYEYTTVAFEEINLDSKIAQLNETKTQIEAQLANLKTTSWTANYREANTDNTINHTANEDNVTIGEKTVSLTELFPMFDKLTYVVLDTIVDGSMEFLYQNIDENGNELVVTYTLENGNIISVYVSIYDGDNSIHYSIEF